MSERDAGSGVVSGQGGRIRVAPDEPGCERIEAFFARRACTNVPDRRGWPDG